MLISAHVEITSMVKNVFLYKTFMNVMNSFATNVLILFRGYFFYLYLTYVEILSHLKGTVPPRIYHNLQNFQKCVFN